MIRARTTVICLLGGFLVCPAALQAGGGPFDIIAQRNVFRLRPVPAPEKPAPPEVPVPTVILKGITTLLGDKLALLSIKMPGAAPAAKEEDCMLREGQRDGSVEVTKIDVKEERVALEVSGKPMVITFDQHDSTAPASDDTSPPMRRPSSFHHRPG